MLPKFLTLCASMILLGSSAFAHPHVFVDARTGFIFNDTGKLQALRISWTYDAFTTLSLFEALNLDKDGDGVFDDADRAAVVKGETEWDREYKGDIYLEVGAQDYPLGRPKDGAAKLENNQIEVSFVLPLSEPAVIEDTPAILRLYDPIFYYAYTILPEDEVSDLPGGCSAKILAFKPDASDSALQKQLAALGREETPSQQNVGRLFSDEVYLTCG